MTCPAVATYAFGIRHRHHQQGVQIGAVLHDLRKVLHHLGIIRVLLRRGHEHDQVIVHEEQQLVASFAFDLQAAANLVGQDGALIGMSLLLRCTACVMHDES